MHSTKPSSGTFAWDLAFLPPPITSTSYWDLSAVWLLLLDAFCMLWITRLPCLVHTAPVMLNVGHANVPGRKNEYAILCFRMSLWKGGNPTRY